MDALTIIEQLFTVTSAVPTIEFFEEVTSTNEVLWGIFDEETLAGEEIETRVAIAQCQTEGRGQWGKSWTSSAGGLYLSMLVPIELDPKNAYSLTIGCVWGITKCLREKGIPVEIKWANDLLLNGKKLGGIKTETKVQEGNITAAVIGVGINYSNETPEVGINLKDFGDGNAQFSIEQFPIEHLAAAVIAGILEAIALLRENSIEVILPLYTKYLKNMGEMVIYEGHLGQIIGVNGQGELLMNMEAEGSRCTVKIPPGGLSLGYESERTP